MQGGGKNNTRGGGANAPLPPIKYSPVMTIQWEEVLTTHTKSVVNLNAVARVPQVTCGLVEIIITQLITSDAHK